MYQRVENNSHKHFTLVLYTFWKCSFTLFTFNTKPSFVQKIKTLELTNIVLQLTDKKVVFVCSNTLRVLPILCSAHYIQCIFITYTQAVTPDEVIFSSKNFYIFYPHIPVTFFS
jgi:hypothetical protein